MLTTIVDFAQSLKIDGCRVRSTPNFIFLCGGEISKAGRFRSARDFFFRHLKSTDRALARRVKLAESVNGWFNHQVFPDLLELENYIAEISDVVVIFVESAGSIAELGAFAASPQLRRKIVPILTDFHDQERSFISDGLVRRLDTSDEQLVHYWSWNPKRLNTTSALDELEAMSEGVLTFLRARGSPEQAAIDITKHEHALLLVADLVYLSGVTTQTEIITCLKALEIEIDRELFDRYLLFLQSVGLVKRVRRSNQSFYVSVSSTSYIRYSYKEGTPPGNRDLTRVIEAIRRHLDPLRKGVLATALRRRR